MKLWRASATYFNGRYWSNPVIHYTVKAGSWQAAIKKAAPTAKQKMIPKGCRSVEEVCISVKDLGKIPAEEQS